MAGNRRLRVLGPLGLALLLTAPLPAAAAGNVIVLEHENDLFALRGLDRWYSSGFKFNWVSLQTPAPRWLQAAAELAPLFQPRDDMPWGWSLEQRLYTPEDLEARPPPADDRPYAGWLNLSFSMAELNHNHLDRLHLGIGIVGPASLAEATQKVTHELFGAQRPAGWHHQLHNEPTLMLSYDRQWRLWPRPYYRGYSGDVGPSVGATLGNAITQAQVGLFWRLGRALPDDFGPPRVSAIPSGAAYFRPTAASGWYLALGLDGRYVAHNVFLDGNSFRDSPSVQRNPWLAEAFFGYVYYWHNLRLSYVFVRRNEEFRGQADKQNFGAVTISWRY